MKLNPKITGALAWTGLVLVLAVPAANMITGEPEAKANLTSDTQQVKSASAAPTAKPAAKPVVPALQSKPASVVETASTSGDAVADFVKSGKKMPSYISGNDSPATDTASTPKPATTKPGTITINPDGTIQKPSATVPTLKPVPTAPADPNVATINPALVAPMPLPASARPAPQSVVVLPPADELPPIFNDNNVASTGPRPPADITPNDQLVTGDQLDEWDSGSLADYLKRRGLMSEAAPSSSQYDADGFFLDEGRNNNGRRSRAVIY